jgi:threonine dehydrogenase-like Zn-dependent dehydrogenase
METRGIYLPGNKEAHVKEWTVSEPRGDDVLIQVKAAALCASDMSIYKGNPLIPGYPSGTFIVGHEPCGIVAQTGPDVRRVREGDRVAIIAFTSCGDCDYCRTGEPMLCAEMGVIGFTAHGGDADYLVVPERMCLPLPDAVSDVVGAISTDVLGNLYSTMNELELGADDLVAIAGCGPMGLAGVLAAAARGATVVAIDPIDSRLQIAEK